MPKIIDHDERRQQIAQAVLSVVARDGVSGVTMREVALEAGWSTGVLNHYYENKRALLVGGLRQASHDSGKNMIRALRSKHGTDQIRAVLEEGMPLDTRRAAMCRIFFFFWAEGISDDGFGSELASYYDSWRGLVHSALDQAIEEGHLQLVDSQRLAEMLVALADGVSIQTMFDPIAMSPDRARSHVAWWIERMERGDATSKPSRATKSVTKQDAKKVAARPKRAAAARP